MLTINPPGGSRAQLSCLGYWPYGYRFSGLRFRSVDSVWGIYFKKWEIQQKDQLKPWPSQCRRRLPHPPSPTHTFLAPPLQHPVLPAPHHKRFNHNYIIKLNSILPSCSRILVQRAFACCLSQLIFSPLHPDSRTNRVDIKYILLLMTTSVDNATSSRSPFPSCSTWHPSDSLATRDKW